MVAMSEVAAADTHEHGAVLADQLEESVTPGNLGKLGMCNFLALTVLGGIIFLGMQAFEWHHLIGERGMSIKRDLFDATFFILTGFHGCHVFGGVVYNGVLLIRGMMGKLPQSKAGLVEIAGLYWHFVDLVWILIFTFIY